MLNSRLSPLAPRSFSVARLLPLAVVLLACAWPAGAAPAPLPAYTVEGPAPATPVYERVAKRETERRDGATRLLAGTGLAELGRIRLHLQRSNVNLTLADYGAAVSDLQRVIAFAPKDADFRVMLARLLWYAGRGADCTTELEIARKLEPKNRNVTLLTALLAFDREDWSAAAAAFESHETSAPDGEKEPYSALYAHLARARLSGPASPAATEALTRAVGFDYWPRPVAETLLGRLEPAALEALAVHPDPSRQRSWLTDVHYYLGERALQRGETEEAIARFRRVLSLGMTTEYEYQFALSRLRRLGVDVSPAAITLEPDADPLPELPPEDPALAGRGADAFDREIHRLIRSGALRLAIERLRENSQGEVSEERMRMLANLLLNTGQSEEGVAALRATLNGDGGDAPILTAIGWTELITALQHGVDPGASGFGRALTAFFDPLNQQTRKEGRQHLEAARDAFERARLMRPENVDLVRTNARVLEFVGQKKGALVIWRQILESHPDDDEAALSAARLLANDKPGEARALVGPILQRHPNHGGAHLVMATVLERTGKGEEARRRREWADFGERLPPRSTLPFTPAHDRALRRIEIKVLTAPNGYQYLDVAKTREGMIAGWMADRASPHTTELLAAALWKPEPDLQKAIAIAREIHGRGQAQVLRTILDNTGNIVAAGAAARVLAEAREPDIFNRVQALLEEDQGLRVVGDIAGALAASADIRAASPLVNLLDPTFETSPRLATDQSSSLAGYFAARARAALALASFDTDLAQGALESGVRNPEVALYCRAGLFALTKDRRHFEAIRHALRYSSFLEMERTLALLEATGDPEAKELAALYRARKTS